MIAVMGALFGTFLGIVFFLLILGAGILGTIFWIWMLVDCATKGGIQTGEKIAWIIVIALLHFIGALIYFFAARPKRKLAASG